MTISSTSAYDLDFKTFEDIKEGVVMIINRAERDLSVTDYHREIKKMC